MKKRIICVIMLLFVCIALVIPKTNAYESTYHYDFYYVGNSFDFVTLNSSISIEDDSFISVNDNKQISPSSNINIGDYRVYKYYAGQPIQGNFRFRTKFNQYRSPNGSNVQINSIEFISNEMIYRDSSMVARSPAPFNYEYSFQYLSENGWVEISRDGSSQGSSNYFVTLNFDIPQYSLLKNVRIYLYNIETELGFERLAFAEQNIIYNSLEYYDSLDISIEQLNPDFGSWLTSSLSGFFNFEIVDGWSFGIIFALIVAIPIILYLLKYFFGG